MTSRLLWRPRESRGTLGEDESRSWTRASKREYVASVNPQNRRESIIHKAAAAPINLGGPIKSYQSVGADRAFSTDVSPKSSSRRICARLRSFPTTGKMKRPNVGRSFEIGRRGGEGRRNFTSRVSEAGEENDGGVLVSRTSRRSSWGGGVEEEGEARKVSLLGPQHPRRRVPPPRPVSPYVRYVPTQLPYRSQHGKVYPEGGRERQDTGANLRGDRIDFSRSPRIFRHFVDL